MADSRILLTKEEADRKAEEKRNQIGIVFENIKTGEIRVASTVEHIAAFFNSSDEGPNAKNKQDFGWRLSPEDLVELERLKQDVTVMERIASSYQIPIEDVADYNVLKYMASTRFNEAARKAQSEGRDYESDYERRVREAREGKKAKQEKKAPAKTKTTKPLEKSTEEETSQDSETDSGKIEESTK